MSRLREGNAAAAAAQAAASARPVSAGLGTQSRGGLLTQAQGGRGSSAGGDGSGGPGLVTQMLGSAVSGGSQHHRVQLIGMSATLPNIGLVADWLGAAVFQTSFRPVRALVPDVARCM